MVYSLHKIYEPPSTPTAKDFLAIASLAKTRLGQKVLSITRECPITDALFCIHLPTNTIIFAMIGTSAPETFMLPVKPNGINWAACSVIKI